MGLASHQTKMLLKVKEMAELQALTSDDYSIKPSREDSIYSRSLASNILN